MQGEKRALGALGMLAELRMTGAQVGRVVWHLMKDLESLKGKAIISVITSVAVIKYSEKKKKTAGKKGVF